MEKNKKPDREANERTLTAEGQNHSSCVCITKARKSDFESRDQRYSWLWSQPSFFGGRTERKKISVSALPPGVLHSCWCTALMQLADFCPAWFVEVTGEFLQVPWQLWASQSGGSWASGATVAPMRGCDLMTFNTRGQEQSRRWCYCASLERWNLKCPCVSLPLSSDINKLRQDSKELNVKIKVIAMEYWNQGGGCRYGGAPWCPAIIRWGAGLGSNSLIPIKVQDFERVQCN